MWREIIVVLLALCCRVSLAQDYFIYGVVQDYKTVVTPRRRSEVYSKCFAGLSFTTCLPNVPDDDIVRNYDLQYYQDLASIQGQFYCLQCCGDPPDYTDTWDLSCPLTEATAVTSNLYGGELWLARKRDDTDTELVQCSIKRTACEYKENGMTLNCDNRPTDTTYLHGYTVTITVQQYDKNFEFWRGVSKCSVESIESEFPLAEGDIFHEKIILVHVPIDTFSSDDFGKMAVITACLLIVVYGTLYFFRRKRCEYCQKKLVFSPRLCYICVLVGAEPPDPVLLKALEERGEHMQGKPPERLGFVQLWAVGCCKCLYNCFTCQCCCKCCCVCFKFCCCCGCCSYCCSCCGKKKDDTMTTPADADTMTAVEAIELGEGMSMKRDDNDDLTQENEEDREESTKRKKKPRKNSVVTAEPADEGSTGAASAQKKRKGNPNVLDYPREVIYEAVKHPSVPS